MWFSADGAPLSAVASVDRYVGLRLSPDGAEALAFVDDVTGTRDIWRIELARNVRSRVTSANQGHFATWSPDGRRIAVTGLTRQAIFERAIDETGTGRPMYRSADGNAFPTDWSRDGSHLLFTLTTPSTGAQHCPGNRLRVWFRRDAA